MLGSRDRAREQVVIGSAQIVQGACPALAAEQDTSAAAFSAIGDRLHHDDIALPDEPGGEAIIAIGVWLGLCACDSTRHRDGGGYTQDAPNFHGGPWIGNAVSAGIEHKSAARASPVPVPCRYAQRGAILTQETNSSTRCQTRENVSEVPCRPSLHRFGAEEWMKTRFAG
jgi:hypothetical protein